MNLIQSCAEWSSEHPKSIVFSDALDERVLQAAGILSENGYMRPLLLGNPLQIRGMAQAAGIAMGAAPIVDPAHSLRLEHYAAALHARLASKGASLGEVRTWLQDPLWFAAMMLATGDTDIVLAGNVSSTSAVLSTALRAIGPAPQIKTVSSMFLMIAPDDGRVLVFSDCGVVPSPTSEQLADIAISSAQSFRNITGQEPRVAMLSFSTLGGVDHPSVTPVQRAVTMIKQRQPDLLVDGELQFDAAFVPSVAQRKAPGSALQGNANVFIFPDLNAGNIGYKIAERLGNYSALGPMIQGLALPMHDLSRGCSAQDIVEVSLLATKMAFGGEGRHRRVPVSGASAAHAAAAS
jgi:phosphotransacetylase